MITKEVISKSLDDAIIKCRKPSYSLISLSNQIKGMLNKFSKKFRGAKIENAWLINGKGEVVKEVTGDKDSVEVNESGYIKEQMEKLCKDILDEYRMKRDDIMEHKENYDFPNDLHNLTSEYQKKLEDYLTEDYLNKHKELLVNVTHNHPSDNFGLFTCLSEPDIMNMLDPSFVMDFTLYNLNRSVTAESGNGTRMTITNLNDVHHRVNRYEIKKAVDNLHNTWFEYMDIMEDKSNKEINRLLREETYDLDSLDDIKRLHSDVDAVVKKESLKVFPEMLQDNIREFEEYGLELRVDWV